VKGKVERGFLNKSKKKADIISISRLFRQTEQSEKKKEKIALQPGRKKKGFEKEKSK